MIAPQELRLGNFVNHNSFGVSKITGILENDLRVEYDGNNYWDDSKYSEPIELSEDWLKKFGFDSNNVAYKIDNDRFIFELYFYDAWNLNYVEKPKFGNGSVELSGYWKIHELQNLFFALTGEELTIKE